MTKSTLRLIIYIAALVILMQALHIKGWSGEGLLFCVGFGFLNYLWDNEDKS